MGQIFYKIQDFLLTIGVTLVMYCMLAGIMILVLYFCRELPVVPYILIVLLPILVGYLMYYGMVGACESLVDERRVDKESIEKLYNPKVRFVCSALITIILIPVFWLIYESMVSTARVIVVGENLEVTDEKYHPGKLLTYNVATITTPKDSTFVINQSKDTLMVYAQYFSTRYYNKNTGESHWGTIRDSKPKMLEILYPGSFSKMERIDYVMPDDYYSIKSYNKDTVAYVLTKFNCEITQEYYSSMVYIIKGEKNIELQKILEGVDNMVKTQKDTVNLTREEGFFHVINDTNTPLVVYVCYYSLSPMDRSKAPSVETILQPGENIKLYGESNINFFREASRISHYTQEYVVQPMSKCPPQIQKEARQFMAGKSARTR